MPANDTRIIILAAGKGTRMRSRKPKVLHEIAGLPMLGHVRTTAESLKPSRIVTVIGQDMDDVAALMAPHGTAIQNPPLGTGHAVLAADKQALKGATGDVFVLYGDTPLIQASTLRAMARRRAKKDNPAVVVLGFTPVDPFGYGRLITDGDQLLRIVEEKDATPDERRLDLCNSGVMCLDGRTALKFLKQINNRNAKKEYYLTDIVEVARANGRAVAYVEADSDEVLGINSRAELADAEAVFQARRRRRALEAGVTMVDPDTVYFSHDTKLAQDVIVAPNVVFGPGVVVERDVTLEAFCHLEGARVRRGSVIGPFARLRPGADIGPDAKVGNFVEVKKARLGTGAKANHLSYLGDADVGAGANIGAGTITCNYDGFGKYQTIIGPGAFIGSNTSLVAPVKIGKDANVAAGSTVTQDVPTDALAITRAEERHIKKGASRFRAKAQSRAKAKVAQQKIKQQKTKKKKK